MDMVGIDAGNYPLRQGQLPAFNSACAFATMRAMTRALVERIEERLEGLGKTAEGASREAGLSRDFIRTLQRRPDTSPKADNLGALATVLGCSVDYLLGRSELLGTPPAAPPVGEVMLPIRANVGAGPWLAVEEISDEPIGWAPAHVIPEYAAWPQWLERVQGDSYNRFIPNSALVHVVDTQAMGYEARHDDVVVVVRSRAQGAFIERTLKQVALTPQGIELWPRSYNEKWSAPLKLTEDLRADEDASVQIVGKVLRAYIDMQSF